MSRPHPVRRTSLPAVLLALVLVGVVLLAACGGGDVPDRSTGTLPLTDETPEPFVVGTVPATDTAPILELIDVCYGECGSAPAGALPSVVVYPDGTIVRYGHETATGTSQSTLAGYAGRLDGPTLASLVDEARAADLAMGGVGVNGTTTGSADGGGTRFVARLDGMQSAFEVPFLGSDAGPLSASDPEQRAALTVVADHLRSLGRAVAVNPRRGARWVVVAAPVAESAPAARSWAGFDPAALESPAGLVNEAPALGLASGVALRCGVVDGADRVDALATAAGGWLAVRVNGSVWAVGGRPLLPHEHGCADVAATVADQHAAELADLRSH
jgi:hypothetical protein